MYLEKGAVLLGQHHQVTFGNILLTKGYNAKVRALILCSCKMLDHSVSPFLGCTSAISVLVFPATCNCNIQHGDVQGRHENYVDMDQEAWYHT